MSRPFRWDVARREQLGTLVRGEPAESYPEFLGDLRRCCARVLGAAGDARLVFVGRSPESLFDYLSGALADTSWASRLALLNLSMRRRADEPAPVPAGVAALRTQLSDISLDPAGIARSPHPIALIDLVDSGETLGTLVDVVVSWAAGAAVDVRAVRRRLRVVGITERQKNSPNTWRWQQRSDWARAFRPSALKGVSVPGRLWDYLGNRQQKVQRSNPPWRWADPEMRQPPRDPEHIAALRLAVMVFEGARMREERGALAGLLADEGAMRYAWLRSLVNELRAGA